MGDQIANIHWIIKKAREFQKNIYFCFIDYAKAFDCVDHNKLWKILQGMGIPNHLTCLLRNLYAGQETTVRTGHGTTDWFQIGKGVHQGCIYCHPAYLTSMQSTTWETLGWKKHKLESRLLGEIISNLTYADDTTLMAESEEEWKSLLMKVKEESEKVGLKLNIQKAKIMTSGPITSWEIDGETAWVGLRGHINFAPLLVGPLLWGYLWSGPVLSKTMGLILISFPLVLLQPSLGHSQSSKTVSSLLPGSAKAETPVLWPPPAKSWLIGKDSDAGRDWGQEEKGTTEDKMAGWHHWLDGREFEWTLGDGDGQGGLACCHSWGRKESDMTEWLNWTELNDLIHIHLICCSSQWWSKECTFFQKNLFLIGGQLLYNIVLISAIHQHESLIGQGVYL